MKKKSLAELLDLISNQKSKLLCQRILADYETALTIIPASRIKHQDWAGGYLDHIIEGMNITDQLYDLFNGLRALPFTKGEAIFLFFIHDFDKLLRFSNTGEQVKYTEDYPEIVKEHLKVNYDYSLNEAELYCLKYVHGEGQDHRPGKRIMSPLTALVHLADVTSARIWFDYGKDKEQW